MQKVRVLFEDSDLVVFEKPAGVLVHPPERKKEGAGESKKPDLIRILRHQTGKSVFPVHRLDRATQGVMVMAFRPEIAGALQSQFKERSVEKGYLLLCRGFTKDLGLLDEPLTSTDDPDSLQSAETKFETLYRFELPIASSRHSSSRFSLVRAVPLTGRFHQIRRHFKKISHPLIGDTVHGDGRQNRSWRELTGDSRLYLMA